MKNTFRRGDFHIIFNSPAHVEIEQFIGCALSITRSMDQPALESRSVTQLKRVILQC